MPQIWPLCADDDVLFKVLDIQQGLADAAKRRGKLRPASASLARAFKEGAKSADSGQPAGRVACASVRLQSCATLSSFGKHAEALEEACAAVLEMDAMWKALTHANGRAMAAHRDNRDVDEVLRNLPPGIKALLKQPPSWLGRAIAVSAEAKHCVALELEYCLRDQKDNAVGLTHDIGRGSKACKSRPSTAPATYAKAKAASCRSTGHFMNIQELKNPNDLITRLHAEGLSLAEALLPPGHPTRERSQKVEAQARGRLQSSGRQAGRGDPEANDTSIPSKTNIVGSEESETSVEAAPVQKSTSCSNGEDQNSLTAACTNVEPMQTATPDIEGHILNGSQIGVESSRTTSSELKPPEQLPKIGIGGSNTSSELKPPEQFPKRQMSTPEIAIEGSRSTSSELKLPEQLPKRPMSAVQTRAHRRVVNPHEHRDRNVNVFKQWLQDQSAWNQLSYLQKKMSSEGGIHDLTKKFRNEQQQFLHNTLKDKDHDELYDLRVNFNGPMFAERKRQQERRQQGNKQSQSPIASTTQLEQSLTHQWESLGGQQWESIVGFRRASPKKKTMNVASDLGKEFAGSLFVSFKSHSEPRPSIISKATSRASVTSASSLNQAQIVGEGAFPS